MLEIILWLPSFHLFPKKKICKKFAESLQRVTHSLPGEWLSHLGFSGYIFLCLEIWEEFEGFMHLFMSACICAHLEVPVSCRLTEDLCSMRQEWIWCFWKVLTYTTQCINTYGKTQDRNAMKHLLQLLINACERVNRNLGLEKSFRGEGAAWVHLRQRQGGLFF